MRLLRFDQATTGRYGPRPLPATASRLDRATVRALRTAPWASRTAVAASLSGRGDRMIYPRGRCLMTALGDLMAQGSGFGPGAVPSDRRCPPLLKRMLVVRSTATTQESHIPGTAGWFARGACRTGACRFAVVAAARSENYTTRETAAQADAAGPMLLQRLIQCSRWEVRNAVASNPSTDPMLLQRLARDESTQVRHRVARHPRCTPQTLMDLVGDIDEDVRDAVAEHPSATAEVLYQLEDRDFSQLRSKIASHSAAPADLLERLAGDARDFVRSAAAANPNTPTAVLARLAADEDEYVSEQANATLNKFA